jgi:hypothetical protein
VAVILRGCLFGTLGVVVGLAVVGDVADIGARHLATSKVEQHIRQVVPHATGVHGRIRSFPFLDVGLNGHIGELGAHIDQLSVAPVTYSDLVIDLRGARVSIGSMVTSLRVNVTQITRGTVTFTLSADELHKAVPTVSPTQLRVSVDAVHRKLVLERPSGSPVTVSLPPTSLVPCIPGVAPGPDGLTLGCSFTAPPSAFTTASTAPTSSTSTTSTAPTSASTTTSPAG